MSPSMGRTSPAQAAAPWVPSPIEHRIATDARAGFALRAHRARPRHARIPQQARAHAARPGGPAQPAVAASNLLWQFRLAFLRPRLLALVPAVPALSRAAAERGNRRA